MDKKNITFCGVRPRDDLSGQRFGKLKVFSPVGKANKNAVVYLCLCDCGNPHYVERSSLVRGKSKSCGCHRGKHGASVGKKITPEYATWKNMKRRCNNKNYHRYQEYGGRGITICEKWKDSFKCFLDDMGNKPFLGAQIDRIDTNKGYSPENCRWVSPKINCRNKRNNRILEFEGEKLCVAEWAERLNVNPNTLRYRIRRNLHIEEILAA